MRLRLECSTYKMETIKLRTVDCRTPLDPRARNEFVNGEPSGSQRRCRQFVIEIANPDIQIITTVRLADKLFVFFPLQHPTSIKSFFNVVSNFPSSDDYFYNFSYVFRSNEKLFK